VQFLLQWGRHVRVLAPESLRHKLAREAEAMARNYQSNS
jgi:predicted DNA-binding transcriptional regulator YafY